jgi:glycosyltransferase involved in cell wall biosynthesis
MQPAFSIVMAVYNRSRHIVPTIKSVLQQSFADFELIMVGDCCTDDTAEVVKPFLSERVIWRNKARAGNQFAPNNAGIEMARGRYIAYLGHDDLWAPGHLSALHRTFLARPDSSIAASGCVCYGPPASPDGRNVSRCPALACGQRRLRRLS